MREYIRRYARNFDFPLFFTWLVLCLFGLVMIYSASMVWAVNRYGWEADHFYRKQLQNLLVAVPALFVGAFIPYRHYKRTGFMVLSLAVTGLMLIVVHFIGFGDDVGARSWMKVGPINVQPSEIAKITFILYFAGVFSKKFEKGTINDFNNSVMPPVFLLALALFSILTETDLGATIILFVIGVSVMAASGMKPKVFLKFSGLVTLAVGICVGVMLLAGKKVLTDGRLSRITTFLDPFNDPLGDGFQLINGYLAIGAGGLKGLGLGESVQKMGYLPEPQTDFIMAIISEELGVFGVAIVLGGLGFIVLRAIVVALKTKDPQARMIAAGIGSLFGFQTFVNLGGMTGLMPLTGVPLPFISYGGTSLILLSFSLGILLNVSMFVKSESRLK
ncbi:FtsW/RodA/SpoVE family cell cycle protein [Edaphobacillus lindanitolerans]|uniref:Probable peptidoglycan glycosyltransferase FtsW n=1 Tax=Edaphobacillus lindanitolerans TaxID=550447 RepID=A0A1U7PJJ1_9BACI|nr:FtsW/RodA/SpoVE family cell cycle protein [Edaphobacillus lindanitolerans]SIT68106.1 cell division-specific peptidoglycan biosynthesis regulator FtsW [Edaphobacillus lindanitolerans]